MKSARRPLTCVRARQDAPPPNASTRFSVVRISEELRPSLHLVLPYGFALLVLAVATPVVFLLGHPDIPLFLALRSVRSR